MSFPGFAILLHSGKFGSGDLKSIEKVLLRMAPDGLVDAKHVAKFAKVTEDVAMNVLDALKDQLVFKTIEAVRCKECHTLQDKANQQKEGVCLSCDSPLTEFEEQVAFQPTESTNEFLREAKVVEPKKVRKILVLVIHGIRTYAEWVTTLEDELADCDNVVVKEAGYGRFDVFRFLFPFYFRAAAVREAKSKILEAKADFPEHDLVIVAHSFGTYVLTKAMKEGLIRPKRIILCGSVLKTKFKWAELPGCPPVDPETGKEAIVNECGDLDWWPVLAKFATIGFGVAGTAGFKGSRVKDRHHRLGHSDYLTEAKPAAFWQRHKKKVLKDYAEESNVSGREFMQRFWRPFILDGEIVRPDYTKTRVTMPLTMGLLELFRIKNCLIVASLILMFCFRNQLVDLIASMVQR